MVTRASGDVTPNWRKVPPGRTRPMPSWMAASLPSRHDDLPALRPVELVGARRGRRAAQLLGRGKPLGVHVDDLNGRRARALGELQHDQAHGPGPVDENVRSEHGPKHVVAANSAGERLDEGGILDPDVVGQRHAVGDGGDRVFRGTARGAHADGRPSLAQVFPPGPAVMALVAVQRRVDGNAGADRELVDGRADRGDHTGELVPGHDWQRWRELAVQDVQVRTAQAARRHGHDGLARSRPGRQPSQPRPRRAS
jgi:hypothetical protein